MAASPAHAALSREVLGEGYLGQLGYAGLDELHQLARRAGAAPGARLLDLCCGTGGFGAWIARATAAEVVGVDASSVAIRLGPSLLPRAVADVDRLPFIDRCFDGIVCLDGFSYALPALAWEAIRVLRPGGRIAILVSLPRGGVEEIRVALAETGFAAIVLEDRTAAAVPLMEDWLAAFKRHALAHIAEVGERYHRSLTGEIERLLRDYATGRAIRALVTATRP